MPRLFTPSQPEAFPNLQFIGAVDPELPEGETPELLAAGFNSSAWRIGNQVVKATKQPKDIASASTLLNAMQYEHETLAQSLGSYMPETQYTLALREGTKEAHVVTLQPFVEATPLPDFLFKLDNPVGPLREFLAKSREVFKKERLMPDIACVEDGFNVLTNSNILIREDDEAQPVLVDTTFGKTQRHDLLGPVWTRFIYAGSLVASARLVLERPRQPLSEAA